MMENIPASNPNQAPAECNAAAFAREVQRIQASGLPGIFLPNSSVMSEQIRRIVVLINPHFASCNVAEDPEIQSLPRVVTSPQANQR
jgi:hypothetical protein